MKSTLECMPCFIDHAIHVARMTTDDEAKQADILKKTLGELARMDMETTPPEMARKIHSIIRSVTGVEDPYRELKDQSTEFAMRLLPLLRKDLEKSGGSFESIVRMVIAGNIIDYGADRHFNLEQAREKILGAQSDPMDAEAVAVLKKAMDRAKKILYIADNCGEAVFDRLLIEPYREKTTLAVRGGAILNDITRREVPMSGLEDLAPIVDTGDTTPGVSLKYSTPEFLRVLKEADLVIAKGQGNYETLSDADLPIVFLFRVKCKVIASLFDNAHGRLCVIPKNISA